jgi:DNA-binding MarR family transcriptional regulator
MTDTRRVMTKLEQLVRVYYAEGYSGELRPAQWQALRYFDQAAEAERTLTAFAKARATTMGTASITVSGLVERGLMERGHGERNVGLRISAEGRRLLERADPYRRIAGAIESLSEDQRAALIAAADAIVAAQSGPQSNSSG